MELLNFLYNILLLFLYSIPLTFSFVLYFQSKKHIYLYTCILFVFFIIDNVTIYMTEFLPWFSRLYDRLLMSVPTVKTLLYTVTLACILLICTTLLKKEKFHFFWVGLIFIMLFQLYTPLLPNGPWKIWIYYFPAQVFMACVGGYGIYTQRKNPKSYPSESDKEFFYVMVFFTIMAVAIAVEDSIVIFHVDCYIPPEIKIQNRSFTQDIMNIGLSFYAMRRFFHKLTQSAAPLSSIEAECPAPEPVSDSTESPNEGPLDTEYVPLQQVSDSDSHADIDAPDNPTDSKLCLFCREYQLTVREEDILTLLLENKNNQEISEELSISVGTTKTHTHNIFQKLGVRKRQQLLDLYQNYSPTASCPVHI